MVRVQHDYRTAENGYPKHPGYPMAETGSQRPIGWIMSQITDNVVAERHREGTRAYIAKNTYWPPPIFIIGVCALQIGLFIYWVIAWPEPVNVMTFCAGCFDYEAEDISIWAFVPEKRSQLWRYVSYSFLHEGVNVILQLIVGFPLEVIHRMWRIGSLYLLAVIFGAMLHYVATPSHLLLGSSAGLYGLLFAFVANLIINWKEIPWRKTKTIIVVAYLALDFFVNFLYPVLLGGSCRRISHAMHIGGIVTGLFYGVFILRNVVEHKWETILRRVCFSIYVLLFVAGIFLVRYVQPNSEVPWATKECRDEFADETNSTTWYDEDYIETTFSP